MGLVLSFQLSAQRNVILIIADDLGTDYLGFYEDHKDTVDVPNLRALVNKGVRFKYAYSNPVCSSTRAGILTGRYSFRTGVGNIVGGIGGSGVLDTNELSIPDLLNKYNPNIAKANIGKWHLHQPNPMNNLKNPLKMGYDHFEGPFIGTLTSYTNWTKYTNGVVSTVTNYATSENVNNAVSWLKTQNQKPFFLWLAFNAPHDPLHLPPAGLHSYTNLSGTQQDIKKNPKEYFKADIQALDHEIGRLFDSLQVLNKLDSTYIIFIGDNGQTPKIAQIADTSRAKGTVYEYGIHIPFFISGPSVVNPGRISDALVNTADIFATVVELFGYADWKTQMSSNKQVDSESILPVLKDQSNDIRPWAFSEIFKPVSDSNDGKAMRNKVYKLIQFNYGKQEFYDLVNDPLETVDLLLSPMSDTQISNYYYLCNEMKNLTGIGINCKVLVGISETDADQFFTYPNPFNRQIQVSEPFKNSQLQLINLLGETIYAGKEIENQDYSHLAPGLYFLRTTGAQNKQVKMIKQ